MSSAVPRWSPVAQGQRPVLIVDDTYRTPARPGVLLVARLKAGNIRPGERLEAQLPDGGHLDVVVQSVDSMTEVTKVNRRLDYCLSQPIPVNLPPVRY